MKKAIAVIAGLFALAFTSPAYAQATRTWVSGVGDDVNPCSRTAPCKTFAGAISKTAAGGEINCLDPGGFGAITITKSITIDCRHGAGFGSILNSGGINGINVNDSATATPGTIDVVIRGVHINGSGSPTLGLNGVRFSSGRSLTLEDVHIEDQSNSGLLVTTNTANVRVYVLNSTITNVRGGAGFGIHLDPTNAAGGNIVLFVDHSQIHNNGSTGIQVRELATAFINNTSIMGHGSGAGVTLELSSTNAHISNSFLANNNFGIFNGNAGGAPTTRLFGTVITGSATSALSINGGSVISYGNNGIRGNNGNEVPTGAVTGTQ